MNDKNDKNNKNDNNDKNGMNHIINIRICIDVEWVSGHKT